MSPEAILGQGYSYEFDYWSIACCMFEMHCGSLPFGINASDPMDIFLDILEK